MWIKTIIDFVSPINRKRYVVDLASREKKMHGPGKELGPAPPLTHNLTQLHSNF